MDIEQLKLILETLEKAGDGAYVVAMFYVIYPYFSALLIFLGFFVGGIIILKSIEKESNRPNITEIKEVTLLEKWGRQLGIVKDGPVHQLELKRTVETISEYVEQKERKNV